MAKKKKETTEYVRPTYKEALAYSNKSNASATNPDYVRPTYQQALKNATQGSSAQVNTAQASQPTTMVDMYKRNQANSATQTTVKPATVTNTATSTTTNTRTSGGGYKKTAQDLYNQREQLEMEKKNLEAMAIPSMDSIARTKVINDELDSVNNQIKSIGADVDISGLERTGRAIWGGTLNYAGGKVGTAAASQQIRANNNGYTDYMVDDLNVRLKNAELTAQTAMGLGDTAGAQAAQEEAETLKKLIAGFDPIAQNEQNIANQLHSASQSLTKKGQENIETASQGLGYIGRSLVQAGASTTQTLLDAGENALFAAAGINVPKMLGFGTRAFGQSFEDAWDKTGGDFDKSFSYAAAQTAKEIVTEKIMNMSPLGKAAYSNGVRNNLERKVSDAIINATERWGKTEGGKLAVKYGLETVESFLEEGLEEAVGDVIEYVLNFEGIVDEDRGTVDALIEQAVNDFIVGGLSGLMGSGGSLAKTGVTATKNAVNDVNTARGLQESYSPESEGGVSLAQQLINNGKESAIGSSAQNYANELQSLLDKGKNVSDRKLGKLARLTTQSEFNEVASNDLIRQGVTEQDADNRADIIDEISTNAEAIEALRAEGVYDLDTKAKVQERRAAIDTALKELASRYSDSFDNINTNTQLEDNVAETGDFSQLREASDSGLYKTGTDSIDNYHVRGKILEEQKQIPKERAFKIAPTIQENNAKQGEIISKVVNQNFGESGRKVYNNYAEQHKDNVSKFYEAFKSFHDAGLIGEDIANVKLKYSTEISNAEAYAAYYSGVNDAKANPNLVKTVDTNYGIVDNDYSSSVDNKIKKAVNNVAKAVGVKVVFTEASKTHNAYYDHATQTVYIASNSDKPILTVLMHEVTHRLEDIAPKAYAEYRKLAYQFTPETIKEQIRANAKAKNVKLTEEALINEVTARYTEKLFDANDEFARLNRRDPNVASELSTALGRTIEKIGNAFSGEAKRLREAKRRWDAVINEARKTIESGYSTVERANAKAYEEGGDLINDKGETIGYAGEHGTIAFSLKTFNDGGRDSFIKYINKQVKKGSLTQEDADDMLAQLDEISKICEKFKGKYAYFGAWSEAEVRMVNGKPMFSVVKPNGEYVMNIDFSLVCKKRRALDAVLNELCRRGSLNNFELLPQSISRINEIIREHDLEIACALCFVDAKRYRNGTVAHDFSGMYNELLNSMVKGKRPTYFNFASDSRITEFNESGRATDFTQLPDSELDFTKINEVLATEPVNKKGHSVNWKIAKYLKENPSGRKACTYGDFLSTAGFDTMKAENPDVLTLFNSKKGSGGAKAIESDNPYLNEILTKTAWTPNKAYAVGGVRIQSFSDYIARMVFDYVQMVADLSAKKLPAHAYTKEAMFALQFGLTGIKINMSLVPDVIKDGIAAGLDKDGNYAWRDGQSFGSDMRRGITAQDGYELALRIQRAAGYTNNCGTIAVGISREHILKMMADPNIRQIIPYHKSSLNPIIAELNNVDKFKDYTDYQNTRYGRSWGADKVGKKLDDKTDAKLEDEFDYYKRYRYGASASKDYAGKGYAAGDAKGVTADYLAWCKEMDFLPVFDEFAYDEEGNIREGYYKMYIDFAAYNEQGEIASQNPVTMTFPTESDAFGSMQSLIEQGLAEDDELARDMYDRNAEGKNKIDAIADEIEKELPAYEQKIRDEFHEAVQKAKAKTEESNKSFDLKDADGNTLTQAQAEYFKDSKVRDTNGRLIPMYHGTKAQFNIFRKDKIGSSGAGRFEGNGFNFTPSRSRAEGYADGVVMSGYLNIINPLSADKKTLSVGQLAGIIREIDKTGDDIISNYYAPERGMQYGSAKYIENGSYEAAKAIYADSENDVDIYSYLSSSGADAAESIRVFEELGYDGLIHYTTDGKIKTAIAFESNQFKNADNTNPTINQDIRYDLKANARGWNIGDENQISMDFGSTQYNADEQAFLDSIKQTEDNLERKGRDLYFSSMYVRAARSKNPKINFVERIAKNDATVEQEIRDLVSKIDDLKLLENISLYGGAGYQKGFKKAVNKFRKIVAERSYVVGIEQGGRDLGLENGRIYLRDVEKLFNELNSVEALKPLAEKVFKTCDFLNVTFRVENSLFGAPTSGIAGEAIEGFVQYKAKYLNDPTVTNQRKATTLLHEAIHACTNYAIDLYKNDRRVLTVDMKKAVESLLKVYSQVREDEELAEMYGSVSEYELLAELANPEFREALQKKSLLQQIFDAIKGFFGITKKEQTLFDAVDGILDYMLDDADIIASEISNNEAMRYFNARDIRYDLKEPTAEDIAIFRKANKNAWRIAEQNVELRKKLESLNGTKAKLRNEQKKNEKLKAQFKQTTESLARPEDCRKYAKYITERVGSSANLKETASEIEALVNHMFSASAENPLAWEDLYERAVNISRRLVEETFVEKEIGTGEKEALNIIRSTRFAVGENTKGGFNSYNEFRLSNFGKLNLARQGREIDDVWKDICEILGMDENSISSPADQLMWMADFVESYDDIREHVYCADEIGEAIDMYASMILDETLAGWQDANGNFQSIEQKPATYADRAERAVGRAKAHGAEMVRKIREEKNAEIEALKNENKQIRNDSLNAIREIIDKENRVKNDALLANTIFYKSREARLSREFKERTAAAARARQESADRKRLLKLVKRMQNLKTTAANKAMIKAVIGDVDTFAVSMLGWKRVELEYMERWRNAEKARYEEEHGQGSYIPDPKLEASIERLKKTQLADFTPYEVSELMEALLYIENSIRTEKKLIDTEDRRMTYEQVSDTIIKLKSMKQHQKLSKLELAELAPMRMFNKLVGYDKTNPLYQRFVDINTGARKAMAYRLEANKKFAKLLNDSEFVKTFDGKTAEKITIKAVDFETKQPVEVAVTPSMMVSLYLHSLNDDNMRHILGGGIEIPNFYAYIKGDMKDANRLRKKVVLQRPEIQAYADEMFKKDRRYREFADITHEYFNGMSRDAINEVSEKLKGYGLASVEDYFPIKVDQNYRMVEFNGIKMDVSLESAGYLKERVLSTKPIKLYGANKVVADAIRDHSNYYGLAIPIKNFTKVWGGTLTKNASSVQDAMFDVWGEEASTWVQKYMEDIQSASKHEPSIFSKIASNYAGAVLTLNASVALKQAASYPTAGSVVGMKPLIKALLSPKKVDESLINKYTPLFENRTLGYSTFELGELAKSGKHLPKILNWIQATDVATTRKLWRAAEIYVRDNFKNLSVNTDEFYKQTAEVYNRIIEETQPNYDVSQRPQLLRNGNEIVKYTVGMFKTQSLQNFNITYEAISEYNIKRHKYISAKTAEAKAEMEGAKERLGMAMVSQVLQTMLFAGIDASMKAFLRKKDYEDAWEFLKEFWASVVSSITGEVVFLKEALDFATSFVNALLDKETSTYYGLEVAPVETVNDMASGAINLARGINKWIDTDSNYDGLDFVRDLNKSVILPASQFTGLPVGGIETMSKAIFSVSAEAINGEYYGKYLRLRLDKNPSSAAAYYDLLFEAYENDMDAYKMIKSDMIKSGDFKKDNIENAIKKRRKKANEEEEETILQKALKKLMGE